MEQENLTRGRSLVPRLAGATAVTVAMVLGGPVGVAAEGQASPEDLPLLPLAGETVVHAAGATALRLDFPIEVRFEDFFQLWEKLSIELHSGSVAFVGLDQLGRCTLVDQGVYGMCMGITGWQFPPGVRDDPERYFPGWGIVSAGPVDLFVVTDGEVTVTLRVAELDGRVEVDARGQVDATLVPAEDFPVTCPAGDCHYLGWGGVAHEIGPGPGYAAVIGQSRIPDEEPSGGTIFGGSVGSTPVQPCAYPSNHSAPDGSPDPDDHPTGCDLGVASEDQRNNTINLALSAAARTVYQATTAGHRPREGGPVYLGFIAGQFNPFEATHGAGWYRVDAVWLTQSYTCPATGCFAARE